MGRHLIEMGLDPSKAFGKILDSVYELQMDGEIVSLEEAIAAAKDLVKAKGFEMDN